MSVKQNNVRKKYDSLVLLLRDVGVRPTRQRLALAEWLFDDGDKHVTAEEVHAAALKMRAQVSLATVYNTLNHFTTSGLLRQVVIDGGQVYFDTNISNHYHIFDETTGCLTDIAAPTVRLTPLPKLPHGTKLSRIDVIVRVRTHA